LRKFLGGEDMPSKKIKQKKTGKSLKKTDGKVRKRIGQRKVRHWPNQREKEFKLREVHSTSRRDYV